jgi:hypothetical protein
MSTTADLLIDEIENAGKELLLLHEHEGSCTNESQKKIAMKIRECTKCEAVMKSREVRFKRAIEQLRLLRDVLNNNY